MLVKCAFYSYIRRVRVPTYPLLRGIVINTTVIVQICPTTTPLSLDHMVFLVIVVVVTPVFDRLPMPA